MLVPGGVLSWLAILLILDVHASLAGQAVLGVMTWLVVGAIGRRESVPVRIQVAVVVLFSTAVEYTFSGWLGVYTYRLGNVPAFVPPGHALVYLGALSLSRSWLFCRHAKLFVALTVAGGGAYAGRSLVSSRPDILGAAWFVCLLGFLRWGRSASLFTAVFVVVTALELWGTHLGTWTWHPLDPTRHITIGNPPSGVAGGYGWFDLAAVLASPRLIRWFRPRGQAIRVRDEGAVQGVAVSLATDESRCRPGWRCGEMTCSPPRVSGSSDSTTSCTGRPPTRRALPRAGGARPRGAARDHLLRRLSKGDGLACRRARTRGGPRPSHASSAARKK